MKKKVFLLCGAGALFGVALSTIITILISLTAGDGRFYPVVPELIADCGGELNAVMLQAALSMLYGAAWAGAALDVYKRQIFLMPPSCPITRLRRLMSFFFASSLRGVCL